METTFRQLIKNYFNFSKKDRNAVITLCVLIFLVMAGIFFVNRIEIIPQNDFTAFLEALEKMEKENLSAASELSLFSFNPNLVSEESIDSLDLPHFIKRNIISYRSSGGSFKRMEDIRRIYGMTDSIFSMIEPYIQLPSEIPFDSEKKPVIRKTFTGNFDPNRAGYDELIDVGFSAFQALNLTKYRDNGGVFIHSEDLLKIYGIDSAFFESIKNSIVIHKIAKEEKENHEIHRPFLVELNSADSLELLSIRGIGPVYASRILKYRELLGGFYTTRQLVEVYGFSQESFNAIRENVTSDSLKLQKIRLNFADYGDLIRHPYFEKKHVDAILNFRRENGPFSSTIQILNAGLVDSATYVSLRPYLTCR